MKIIALLAILAGLWIAYHPYHAETTKNQPPVACELFGGQWDLWHGWTCGNINEIDNGLPGTTN